MSKKVYIIHGWGGSPEEAMHKWLKKELEVKGFEVVAPEMPNPEEPEVNAWIYKLNEVVNEVNEDIYFIGHSMGCQTIMRYLEKQPGESKVGGIVFIAPWFHLQGLEEEEGAEEIAKPWIENQINLDRVKSHINNVVAIFSDNDPYVPLSDKEIFKEKLGAEIIVEHDKGHFIGNDGVTDNPIALNKLLEIANGK